MFKNIDNQFIYLALNKLLNEDIKVLNKYNKDCRLVYSEGYYFPLDTNYFRIDSSGTRIVKEQIEYPIPSRIKK